MKKIYFLPVIITQCIIRLVTGGLFLIFCNLKVKGFSNLDKYKGPLIFASNHASEWDGPLVRTVMPMICRFAPMFYVSMAKEFYVNSGWRQHIYGGAFFKLVGAYPVYYGLKDFKKSLKNHIRIVGDGGSVNIFPEGRCSKTGEVAEFKAGVIALSDITNTSIVPVYIKDTYNLTRKEFFSRKRHVTITFGEPYKPQIGSSLSDEQLLAEYKGKVIELRNKILELSKK
jgi:1-acyl-sn-glycerol-3-phosphate acyltransferase